MLPLLGPVLEIVKGFIPDADKQMELKKAMLEQEEKLEKHFAQYAKMDHDLRIKEIEHKGFKASWRPYIMFSLSTIMVLYLFTYYILPQIIVVGDFNVYYLEPIPMPDVVWQVFAFCIVGVAGLRTIDKWRQK